jgi:hypothetical protein
MDARHVERGTDIPSLRSKKLDANEPPAMPARPAHQNSGCWLAGRK